MKLVALGELVLDVETWNPQREVEDAFFNYIDISSVNQESKQIGEWKRIRSNEAPSRARQLVCSEDVLVSTVRPNLNGVAQVPLSLHGAIASTGFCVLRPNTVMLNSRYLFHWVRSIQFVKDMTMRATGASYPAVTDGIIKDSKIPLPSLSEQRRIAAILDKADSLREKRRQAIAKLDELLRSIFIQMFGDPVTNPKGWKKIPMGDLMTIRRGGSPRPIEKYLGGNINWIKIGDATNGNEIYLESCKDKIIPEGLKRTVYLKPGSLVFANCGVSLGFARILKIDGCIHDGWLSFENIPEDKLDKIFLLKVLNGITEYFRETVPAGTQPNLNTGIMKNFEIIAPPLSLQKKFSAFIEKSEAMRSNFSASEKKIDALFQSLQHRAFSGELFTEKITSTPFLAEVVQHA